MCFTKMVRESYLNYSSIFNLVNYVLCDKSTGKRVRFYGGYNVDIDRADEQIMHVKNYYRKGDGRKMRHFIVSFGDEISAACDFVQTQLHIIDGYFTFKNRYFAGMQQNYPDYMQRSSKVAEIKAHKCVIFITCINS